MKRLSCNLEYLTRLMNRVWSEMISGIKALRAAWMFEPQSVQDALNKFELRLIGKKANELGWKFDKDEDHIMVKFKALMFGAAGKAGDPDVKAAALQMFSNFVKGDKAAIWPDIRDHTFSMATQYGGEKEYNALLDIYLHPPSEEVKISALCALGVARTHSLIERTLELSISKDVKYQDMPSLLAGLHGHKNGVLRLWEWAKENWNEIARILSVPVIILGHVVKIITSGVITLEHLAEVETFFKFKSTAGFDKSLGQSIDSIKSKHKWVQRDASDVRDYLIENGYLDK